MRLKHKIPSFIFGLSIGLVIGVGFFLFKISDIFNNIKESAREKITIIERPVKNVKEEETDKKKNKERFKVNVSKSTRVNYKEVDSLIKKDAELNVATDELLSVKSVKVIRIDDAPAQDTSAVAKLSGLETKHSGLFFLEFWRTPLNSRGYRFTKNKIMLYGFMDYTNILLYQVENDFYIKSSDKVYKLEYSGDFKQLERVIDNEVLAKIN